MCIRDSINAEYMGFQIPFNPLFQKMKRQSSLLNFFQLSQSKQNTNDLNTPSFQQPNATPKHQPPTVHKVMSQMSIESPQTPNDNDDEYIPQNKLKKLVKTSEQKEEKKIVQFKDCLLYTSPSPRDRQKSRMPSSA
eukprot:TRINITY_DN9309_c0_g1_i2.p1 TRINITY_DN9309_c0_g1~~TRINITY_DN9309_c0_g1_i2.p1  ORF type:complete len:136 (-),score=27.10 TRINITY_DN9309_c0_g1_i2:54-461(-)